MKQPNDFLMFLKNKHYYSLFRQNFSSPKANSIYRENFIFRLYANKHWRNSSLLAWAFIWRKSNEGYNFWANIFEEMARNENNLNEYVQ